MAKHRALILALLFGMSLFFRIRGLGDVGLSEDEANKILAVESYRRGDFSPNGEHPMLMKLLATVSIIASEQWNRFFPHSIRPEAAVRFPSAFSGAATTVAVYLLGVELLNPPAALMAAALWAVDPNALALTRIAKEDSLITLFFVLASTFLLRARRFHFEDSARAVRNCVACGFSFGLLFASKYLIPILWMPLAYYDSFRFGKEPRWRIHRSTWLKMYGAFAAGLLIFNPILLSPATLTVMWSQFTHKRMAHTGYLMMGEVYSNKAYETLWGTPAYYYPLYFLVKTPWPLLVLLLLGLWYTLKRFRDARFLFLGMYFVVWLFLISLSGGKFTRYVVSLLPAAILLQSLGLYIIYSAAQSHFGKRGWGSAPASVLLVFSLCATVGWHVVQDFQLHPFYSLYVSAQGGGKAKRGYYFSQDDFYDAGLREAIEFVCRTAPPNGKILGTTPEAFRYYQAVFGRPDLKFQSTAEKNFALNASETPFILYQEYRAYLENLYLLTFFRSELRPQYVAEVQGIPSVIVYRLSRDAACARAPFWQWKRWPGILRSLGDGT